MGSRRHALGMGWLAGALLALPLLLCGPATRPVLAEPEPETVLAFEDEAVYEDLAPFGARGLGSSVPKKVRRAIERGLRWLRVHQAPDGRFPAAEFPKWCDGHNMGTSNKRLTGVGKAEHDVGTTALGTLAFLGAGYTHQTPGPEGAAVAKALAYLRRVQDAAGAVGPRTSAPWIYSHAFGALALVEAFGMTGDEALHDPAQRALDLVEDARNPYFAWRYGVKPGDNDTSISANMFAVIHAAMRINESAAAAERPPPLRYDREAAEGVTFWLEKMTDPETGSVGYITRRSGAARPKELAYAFPGHLSDSLTSSAIVTLLGCGHDPETHPVLKPMMKGHPSPLPSWSDRGSIDFYYWYWGSRAAWQMGDKTWKRWERQLHGALIKNQVKGGDECFGLGSWDAAGPWGKDGGRVYSTALAVLALLTPYRDSRFHPKLAPDPVHRRNADRRDDRLRIATDASVDPAIRARVLRRLSWIHTDTLVPALIKALGDEHPRVREGALHMLGRLGEPARAAEALVGARVADADAGVRRAALRCLRGMGSTAYGPAVTKACADPVAGVRAAAAELRWAHDKDAKAALTILTSNMNTSAAETRYEALRVIARMGAEGKPAEDAVRRRLTDDDERVQLAAAYALLRMGAPVTHSMQRLLVGAIRDGPVLDARLALRALRERNIHEPETTRALIQAASSAWEPRVRQRAVEHLATHPEPTTELYVALTLASHEGGFAVANAAKGALKKLPGPKASLAPGLIRALDQRATSAAAQRALVAQGPSALSALFEAVGERFHRGLYLTITELTAIDAGPAVTALEKHPRPRVREMALRVLGERKPIAAASIPAIVRAAADANDRVRSDALRALGKLGWTRIPTTGLPPESELIGQLGAGEPATRRYALAALAAGGVQAPAGISSMAARLEDVDESVREVAHEALVAIGVPAVPALLSLLDSPSQDAKQLAARTLGLIGKPAHPAATRLAAGLRVPEEREEARRALSRIGKPAVAAVIPYLKHDEGIVRRYAAWALATMPAGEAVDAIPELYAIIDGLDPEAIDNALHALKRIGKRALPSLKRLLKHNHQVVRRYSAEMIGRIGDKSAVSALRAAFKAEWNDAVKKAINIALSRCIR